MEQSPGPIPIYTIGYGNRSIEQFISVLQRHEIAYLIDVRSVPYSRYKPEFSKTALEKELKRYGIRYVFMGDTLGGRPDDDACYIDGRVDYEKVMDTKRYQSGIERLRTVFEQQQCAVIMCSEGRPEHCHRCKLIGATLTKQGISTSHIDENEETSDARQCHSATDRGTTDLVWRRPITLAPDLPMKGEIPREVIIVATTRMLSGVCVGAIAQRRKSVRIVNADVNDRVWQVGDVWKITFRPASLRLPHIEDIEVDRRRYVKQLSAKRMVSVIEKLMPPICGGPGKLYEGLLRSTQRGALYIAERTGIPNYSTTFWRTDQPLIRVSDVPRVRYCYPTEDGDRTVPFVGFPRTT